jgi:hypothetical protein
MSCIRPFFPATGILRLGVACLIALAPPVLGQQPRKAPVDAEPEVLSWELTVAGAGAFWVSTSDLERALSDAGYGQPPPESPGGFLSASVAPSLRYRIGDRFAVGVSGASAKIGYTTASAPAPVTIHRTSADLAALFFWRPVPGVRLGAGPAWFRLTAAPNGGADLTANRLGAVFEGGVAFPEAGRWYVDLAFQYRLTGDVDLGTYTPPQAGIRPNPPIPLDGISFSHAAFVAGIGYRF